MLPYGAGAQAYFPSPADLLQEGNVSAAWFFSGKHWQTKPVAHPTMPALYIFHISSVSDKVALVLILFFATPRARMLFRWFACQ